MLDVYGNRIDVGDTVVSIHNLSNRKHIVSRIEDEWLVIDGNRHIPASIVMDAWETYGSDEKRNRQLERSRRSYLRRRRLKPTTIIPLPPDTGLLANMRKVRETRLGLDAGWEV